MNNIKVLLADDEPVILRGLQLLIPWKELGAEIVGEAYDGDELRQMLDTCNPDVVISDISMPGLTGIDIIREVHETDRDVKIIFISAYQEFTYAQDALKYGAVDYLIKPVDKERLEQVMRKVIRLIGEQKERIREREMASQFEREKRNDAIGELIERLTDGDRASISQLRQMGVLTDRAWITVCFGELDGISLDGTNRWQEQERKLLDFSISNVIGEAVTLSTRGVYFRKGHLHGIFFQHDELEEPLSFANDLHSKINEYLKVSFTIGIGNPVPIAAETSNSAKCALHVLKDKYFEGFNRVITRLDPIPDSEAEVESSFEGLQLQLVGSLSRPPLDVREEIINELLQALRISSNNKATAVSAVYGTYIRLQRELKEMGLSRDLSDSDSHAVLEQLNGYETYDQLAEYASSLFSRMREQATEQLGSQELKQLVTG